MIGTAVGYCEAQLVPFVRSLRQTGYEGEIILIVHADDFSSLARSTVMPDVSWHPVQTLRLNLRFHRGRYEKLWLPLQLLELWAVRAVGRLPVRGEKRRAMQRLAAGRLFHPELSRFVYYEALLLELSVDRVLLTDVRDVVFQTNPFEALGDEALAFGMETGEYSNDTEYWNRRWLRATYGEAMVKRLAGRQVSCAGVGYGSRQEILSYLGHMIDELLAFSLAGFAQMADQAIHNALLWTGTLGSPAMLQPLASPIATLNFFTLERLDLDDRGRLLNQDGSVVSVLHQYDRIPGLLERLACCRP